MPIFHSIVFAIGNRNAVKAFGMFFDLWLGCLCRPILWGFTGPVCGSNLRHKVKFCSKNYNAFRYSIIVSCGKCYYIFFGGRSRNDDIEPVLYIVFNLLKKRNTPEIALSYLKVLAKNYQA